MHDYSNYSDGPGDNLLAQIAATAVDQQKAELAVEACTEALKKAKEVLCKVSETTLPDLMDKAEMSEFVTADGALHIKLGEKIRASIPKDPSLQKEAFDWLDDNGHDGLIKRQFAIEFSRDEEKWANRFEGDLKRRKRQLMVKRKKSVHSGTLSSFVKEQLGEGVKLPMKAFGVFRQRFTKVEVKV